MPETVLSQSWDRLTVGDWTLSNNTWGAGALVNGADYTQTLTVDPAIGIGSVQMAWDWPDGGRVMGYPEVIAGRSPWDGLGNDDLVVRVGDLRSLELEFDLELVGDPANYNIAIDLWLTDTRAGGAEAITHEILFTLHDPFGVWDGVDGAVDDPTSDYAADWQITVRNEPGYTWDFVYASVPADMLEGSIDLAALLDQLIAAGVIDGTEWFNGIELGCEVVRGQGGLVINALDYDLTTYAATRGADQLRGTMRPDRIEGRAGDDLLQGRGGRDVLFGGRGDDTLAGGGGRDILTGGAGADRFVFSCADLDATDRIRDFGPRDLIDLRRADGDRTIAMDWQGQGALAGDGQPSVRWVQTPNGVRLLADTDGDGTADLTILLRGVTYLSQDDVLL